MKKLVLLLLFLAHLSFAQTSITKWSGMLNAGGRKVEMILNILPDTNGTFKSSWDIPAQKVKALSSTKTEWKNSSLAIEIKWIAAGFTGELSEDGKKITGNWGQAGQQFPLVLEPFVEGKVIPVVEKPQTPKAPFSYESREFVYQGAKTKLTYGATLTYPKDGGKHPFIVLITGSGAQDRDETIFDHKPFAVLADFLTKNGFAVMRVDDRGVGKSNGVFQASTTGDFALDVEEHLNYAKQLPEVDSTKMGLLGHSEGGLIAPMVAARNKSVAFVILMARQELALMHKMGCKARLQSEGLCHKLLTRYYLAVLSEDGAILEGISITGAFGAPSLDKNCAGALKLGGISWAPLGRFSGTFSTGRTTGFSSCFGFLLSTVMEMRRFKGSFKSSGLSGTVLAKPIT